MSLFIRGVRHEIGLGTGNIGDGSFSSITSTSASTITSLDGKKKRRRTDDDDGLPQEPSDSGAESCHIP